MSLLALRTAIVDAIQEQLPAADCKTHPGRFDLSEIKRIATKTPAIRIAVLGLPTGAEAGSGEHDREVRFAAFVLTTDKPSLPRDVAALAMVGALIAALPGQRWGRPGVHPVDAAKVAADNLYSSGVDGTGLALWAVTWSQRIRMGENAWPQGPILADEVYAGDGS